MLGHVLQVLHSIIGVVLLFILFDDWRMRWLIAIIVCAFFCVVGYATRILFSGISIVVENHYIQLGIKEEKKQ
jgi:Ca2+/Na+ antiporter